jgi:hypothetical protein
MTMALSASRGQSEQSVWLLGRRWDLALVLFSAILVPVPMIVHLITGLPNGAIDIIVAAIIGGPHMYATLTFSFMERRFLRAYPLYAFGAIAIPIFVFYLASVNLTLLLTGFMLWASVHVMHQVAFLADCYRVRSGEALLGTSRAIDYSVLFLCMYPFAIYRMVNDDFIMGNGQQLHSYFPAFLKGDLVIGLVTGGFIAALLVFVAKSVNEWRSGKLNVPKTLLISLAVFFGFMAPSFRNLDVAFQGMNVWHSVQYLAVIWYLNRMRKDRGEVTNPIVAWLSGRGRGFYFYLFNVVLTVMAGGLVLFLIGVVRLPQEQAYYSVILSFLLVHYYIDHGLFFRARAGAGETALWPAGSSSAAQTN